ncbi:MAG: hypothetical protein VCD00_18960 [Candidatus Hydrogenedentota bacterium]
MSLNEFSRLLPAALIVATSITATAAPITWTKDVMPIVQERCLNCHRPGQVAPFSLESFEQARPWAKSIREQVAAGKMPPYPGKPGEMGFHGDANMTEKEITTFIAWVDQGAKQGNPADLPPKKVFKTFEGGWVNRVPDIVLQPEEPFLVGADVSDLYYCFKIPFNADQDLWLKSAEFQAGNSEVVHHFILFEDTSGVFDKLDAETPEPGCECANMDKLAGAKIVQMWAPGNVAPLSPEGVGLKLSKGKDLILQTHYYNSTGLEQVDHSRIALHLAQPEETIEKQIRAMMVVQPNLNIKAGDPNSEHTATFTAFKDLTMYSVGGHMHLRGKSISQTAKLPDSDRELLMLDIPDYDFDWQFTYPFEKPWKFPKGSKFIMRSVHDNSEGNPNNPDPTADVKWGLYSGDEMAFTGGSYTFDDEQLGITPTALSDADRARLTKNSSTD